MGFGDCVHEAIPHDGFAPPVEAVVDRRRGHSGQVGPASARVQDPEDAIRAGHTVAWP